MPAVAMTTTTSSLTPSTRAFRSVGRNRRVVVIHAAASGSKNDPPRSSEKRAGAGSGSSSPAIDRRRRVRHSMRVTRLRDLIEISPDLWAPAEEVEVAEDAALGDGLAQAVVFKEMLLASMHFRLYSQRDLGNGRYAVRFLMGSPRMEGLDDVQRVTSAVCDTCGPLCDEGLMSLVPDSECGMSVAEIQFPLPFLETPDEDAVLSRAATPAELRVERLDAVVRGLESQIIDESVVCLMEKGSDDRSTFFGKARLNKYFTGMHAREADLLHRGTCTSSSPTPGALEASREMLTRMWDGEEHADVELVDEVRARVEKLFCGGAGRMILHPSGTDAETMPLLQAVLESRALARESSDETSRPEAFRGEHATRGNVVSLVACAGEVGSGTTEASMGRFFSRSCPLGGNRVEMGQELPALHDLAEMRAVELVARGADDPTGAARDDYDAFVIDEARKALAADPCAVVVLHTVAGSKTGLRLPSPDVASLLRAEYGDRVVSVLDACQMRHNPTLVPRWLADPVAGGPVLMTSSKFFGGPSFGSGVFFPHASIERMNELLEAEPPATVAAMAEACASYLTHHDIGDVLPKLHDAMPPGFCNVGVLLRWAAGLHEMETLEAATAMHGGMENTEATVRSWVTATRSLATEFEPHLEYVPAVDYGGDWQLGGVNTIVSVRIRNSGGGSDSGSEYMSTAKLKKVYALMTADISEFLAPESTMAERRVASQRCLTGQPVDIPGGSVLRTVLGAAQLKDLVTGKQDLPTMLEDDRVLFAKLALIARQYDHLLSHSL